MVEFVGYIPRPLLIRRDSQTMKNKVRHRFLDEAGDTTFYGKGRNLILGTPGVSLSFSIGMTKINADLPTVREAVKRLQIEIGNLCYAALRS